MIATAANSRVLSCSPPQWGCFRLKTLATKFPGCPVLALRPSAPLRLICPPNFTPISDSPDLVRSSVFPHLPRHFFKIVTARAFHLAHLWNMAYVFPGCGRAKGLARLYFPQPATDSHEHYLVPPPRLLCSSVAAHLFAAPLAARKDAPDSGSASHPPAKFSHCG